MTGSFEHPPRSALPTFCARELRNTRASRSSRFLSFEAGGLQFGAPASARCGRAWTEVAWDDVDRDTLASELDGMRMAQPMRREPSSHAGLQRERALLGAGRGR
jgi:hypothetical protein